MALILSDHRTSEARVARRARNPNPLLPPEAFFFRRGRTNAKTLEEINWFVNSFARVFAIRESARDIFGTQGCLGPVLRRFSGVFGIQSLHAFRYTMGPLGRAAELSASRRRNAPSVYGDSRLGWVRPGSPRSRSGRRSPPSPPAAPALRANRAARRQNAACHPPPPLQPQPG